MLLRRTPHSLRSGSVIIRGCTFSRRGLHTLFKLFPQTFPQGTPTWDVDQSLLRREYRNLQAKVHPDANSNAATDESSTLNKNYHTLKDPLRRAQYLILLHEGVDLTSDEQSKAQSFVPPTLLMEVLEVHEELQYAEDAAVVSKIAAENKARIDAVQESLGRAFRTGDYAAAISLTVELKYWTNLAKAIKEWSPGARIDLSH
ncbi:J-type chaperone JAC1 KNAG_0D03310 [Huiozyma naganishii CBS 8797]|uniref:J domain-containing protein n=1 Tax=Huiozyma naganishii (strain ATCC MYA-139 / BCRC 22969 / CBS 8797 / KCTC 17520 / NBRC 10181 / NCYC 3082 / Yp74L-3) TaxID=1071383 RepID=J7RY74_HUIN7|nr:hypothetical protein KNAG_0D03310 [Kazachstania naganishii CBS 8797]CCK70077.1 hypothetical protein KNAG_0D03310 [Kazachstania naganishii CBS 8797]